jgi:hypothetical protein
MMIFEIELLRVGSKILYNAYKKDRLGVEYACAADFQSEEAAVNIIRNKWKHNGPIRVIGPDNEIKTIGGL